MFLQRSRNESQEEPNTAFSFVHCRSPVWCVLPSHPCAQVYTKYQFPAITLSYLKRILLPQPDGSSFLCSCLLSFPHRRRICFEYSASKIFVLFILPRALPPITTSKHVPKKSNGILARTGEPVTPIRTVVRTSAFKGLLEASRSNQRNRYSWIMLDR